MSRHPFFSLALATVAISTVGLATAAAGRADTVVFPPAKRFVDIKQVDDSIIVDGAYVTEHNFLGRPVKGYQARTCILTREAARAVANAQAEARSKGFTLKIHDCYRPQRAVDDFKRWASDLRAQRMKTEFYPRVDKRDVFKLGYVAERSGHSRGSTLDVTLARLLYTPGPRYRRGQALVDCAAPYGERFNDGSIDMGTAIDCFDERSHTLNSNISEEARHNRMYLNGLMKRHGFNDYQYEWWHFTLKDEPFPTTFFDFPVGRRTFEA